MNRGSTLLTILAALCAPAPAEKLTTQERIEIMRGLTAEYATMKVPLPRSPKALQVRASGEWDHKQWAEMATKNGPAARIGDLVQVSKVTIEDDKLILEINGGFKGGRKWYEHLEVGMGGSTAPIGNTQSNAPGGTTIALLFDGKTPALKTAEIKKMLVPIMDFERRTSTENYVDTLPEPIKIAIKEKRGIEGMDREQIILALGRPVNKIRETKDGVDLEDWIYGQPPGKITFVTFEGNKVVAIKDTYAGLGGSTAPPLQPR
jgi:hypothetical protein